jgi:hypothetical protein
MHIDGTIAQDFARSYVGQHAEGYLSGARRLWDSDRFAVIAVSPDGSQARLLAEISVSYSYVGIERTYV